MAKTQSIIVKDTTIRSFVQNGMDFICITDIARQKNAEDPNGVVGNWMRNRNTLEYLGLWEMLNNPDFNPLEFEGFRNQAGLNAFTLSPSRWIEATRAIGLVAMSGRYGGTYAQRDIAFKFASWVSAEFELYLIKEFQRLKEEEQKALGWSAKRELPQEIDQYHRSLIYANEADVLNVALFGITAKEWRDAHPGDKGNIRDYATINQLICLSNMENLNAVFINEGMPQQERLHKLNQIAIQQMTVLENVESKHILKA